MKLATIGAAFLGAAVLLQPTLAREWVDKTGKHRTEAELLRVEDDSVLLEKSNGKTIKVPIELLGKDDQEYVRKLMAESKPSDEKKQPRKSRFEQLDTNGDGKIVRDEVAPENLPQFDMLLAVVDKDNSGDISKAEFESGLKAIGDLDPRQFPGAFPGMPEPGGRGKRGARRPRAGGAQEKVYSIPLPVGGSGVSVNEGAMLVEKLGEFPLKLWVVEKNSAVVKKTDLTLERGECEAFLKSLKAARSSTLYTGGSHAWNGFHEVPVDQTKGSRALAAAIASAGIDAPAKIGIFIAGDMCVISPKSDACYYLNR